MNRSISPKAKLIGVFTNCGFTLIELIVATTIMLILVGAVLPLAKNAVQREREHELRQDLWMIRDSIDRYKDAADRGAFQIKVDSGGYPPDLDTLVTGVDIGGKKKNEIPASSPGRSNDRVNGVGNAIDAG